MPKNKPCLRNLENFYKKDKIDTLMFGYVEGILSVIPSMTLRRAIEKWLIKYGLEEDDYPLDVAEVTYRRIKKSFIETINLGSANIKL